MQAGALREDADCGDVTEARERADAAMLRLVQQPRVTRASLSTYAALAQRALTEVAHLATLAAAAASRR